MCGLDGAAVAKALTVKVLISPRKTMIKAARTVAEAGAVRDSLAKALYGSLFAWIVARINTAVGEGITPASTSGHEVKSPSSKVTSPASKAASPASKVSSPVSSPEKGGEKAKAGGKAVGFAVEAKKDASALSPSSADKAGGGSGSKPKRRVGFAAAEEGETHHHQEEGKKSGEASPPSAGTPTNGHGHGHGEGQKPTKTTIGILDIFGFEVFEFNS